MNSARSSKSPFLTKISISFKSSSGKRILTCLVATRHSIDINNKLISIASDMQEKIQIGFRLEPDLYEKVQKYMKEEQILTVSGAVRRIIAKALS